jgi:hypothetical protein
MQQDGLELFNINNAKFPELVSNQSNLSDFVQNITFTLKNNLQKNIDIQTNYNNIIAQSKIKLDPKMNTNIKFIADNNFYYYVRLRSLNIIPIMGYYKLI